MGHLTDPALVELCADATWPAEQSVPLGPWRLRATHGYSHRANSVRSACADGSAGPHVSWLDLIAKAEAFYRRHNLPPMFHISAATAPRDLDEVLARRGYSIENVAEVWLADPAEVRDATARPNLLGNIVLRDDPDDGWLGCAFDEHIGTIDIREEICRRVPAPRVFALIVEQNQPVARALGVVHAGVGWVYCMATIPGCQRRGHARRLLNTLAQWTMSNDGRKLYLQVMADNAAAHSLYAGAKFTKQYDYHYRVLRHPKAG